MQFIPKKEELVLSCFRNSLQRRITETGVTNRIKKTAKNLMKISALYSEPFYQPTDIELMIRKLFAALYTVNLRNEKEFDFMISGSAYGYIDRKALYTVILEISSSEKTVVDITDKKIKITAEGICFGDYLKALCKKFKFLYFISERKATVIIPFEKCPERENGNCDITDLILNPLSCINLWLQ